jgi:hypothetical protein
VVVARPVRLRAGRGACSRLAGSLGGEQAQVSSGSIAERGPGARSAGEKAVPVASISRSGFRQQFALYEPCGLQTRENLLLWTREKECD